MAEKKKIGIITAKFASATPFFGANKTSVCCLAGEAVLAACEKACGLIDMREHQGVHPCMGAVDLIPIYPLGEEVGVEECSEEARGKFTSHPSASHHLLFWRLCRFCSLKSRECFQSSGRLK